MARDVFISFSTPDQAIAEDVLERLENKGHSAWLCTRLEDNRPGGDWTVRLDEELQNCRAVVFLYSGASGRSDFVRREIEMAVCLKKPILVVRLDNSPFPTGLDYLLRTLQNLNAVDVEPERWFKHVTHFVSRHCQCEQLFPIDSIDDRALKVKLCVKLKNEIYNERSVKLIGRGICFEELSRLFCSQPQIFEHVFANVNSFLNQTMRVAADSPYQRLAFYSKENVLLMVAVFPMEDSELEQKVDQELDVITSRLARIINGLTDASVISSTHYLVTASRKAMEEAIAHFLTNLGKVRGNAITNLSTYTTDDAIDWPDISKLPNELRMRHKFGDWCAATGTLAFSLPRLLTCHAAAEYMRDALSASGGRS